MKLKIISDGTSAGTKVVNAETGEELKNVVRIQWEIEGRGRARATIELDGVMFEGSALGGK